MGIKYFDHVVVKSKPKWLDEIKLTSNYCTKPFCLKISNMAAPILAGDSTTVTPASLRVLILSWAVPLPPDTIAAQANQGCTINIKWISTWSRESQYKSWKCFIVITKGIYSKAYLELDLVSYYNIKTCARF